jgi:hypothetical protein
MKSKLIALVSGENTQKLMMLALAALAVLVPATGGFQTFDQPPMTI